VLLVEDNPERRDRCGRIISSSAAAGGQGVSAEARGRDADRRKDIDLVFSDIVMQA